MICGVQPEPKNMQLVRGFYGTAINILNTKSDPVRIRKTLVLTFPPKAEKPGRSFPIAQHRVPGRLALEVDCYDVLDEVFKGQFPERYIKGFVIVESEDQLDVTAVYTTAGLDREGQVTSVTSIDVEQIAAAPPKNMCPDLAIRDIGPPSVSCPGGGGTCVTKLEYTIANIGNAAAGPFMSRAVLDPRQSVVVDETIAGLAAGAGRPVTVTTPPGGNCFDPDCTVTVTVDPMNAVPECKEDNNTQAKTTPG